MICLNMISPSVADSNMRVSDKRFCQHLHYLFIQGCAASCCIATVTGTGLHWLFAIDVGAERTGSFYSVAT